MEFKAKCQNCNIKVNGHFLEYVVKDKVDCSYLPQFSFQIASHHWHCLKSNVTLENTKSKERVKCDIPSPLETHI